MTNASKKRIIITTLSIICVSVVFSFLDGKKSVGKTVALVPVVEESSATGYGAAVDSLIKTGVCVLINDKIAPRRNFSSILKNHDVRYSVIRDIVRNSKGFFNLRRLRPGKRFALVQTKGPVRETLFFIYEENPIDYVAFDLREGVKVERRQKEVEIRRNSSSGIIRSSHWNGVSVFGEGPDLTNKLSNIFSWDFDFSACRVGDRYKVVFEEKYVCGEKIGIGKVLAAWFNLSGRDYYAFGFNRGGSFDYFDEYGKCLSREYLRSPLRYRRISSRFSNSRFHPVLRRRTPHHGVDFAAPVGTPVRTVGDGVVLSVGWHGAAGRMVVIKHNETHTTRYLHLSRYARGIKPGTRVKKGDAIGRVGSSGLSTGPHLDFRFYENGKAVNPFTIDAPRLPSVKPAHIKDFLRHRDSLIEELDLAPPQNLIREMNRRS